MAELEVMNLHLTYKIHQFLFVILLYQGIFFEQGFELKDFA